MKPGRRATGCLTDHKAVITAMQDQERFIDAGSVFAHFFLDLEVFGAPAGGQYLEDLRIILVLEHFPGIARKAVQD